ncbi:MAG: response regulator [Armatimonadetes bacterium]|nr:response regulator [Armatimonadota bacterium]
MARILVVDDEEAVLSAVERRLKREGHEVTVTSEVPEACRLLREAKQFDVVLTDMSMDAPKAGLQVLQAAFARDLFAMVIVMTAYATVENAVECMRRGAFDYIEKHSPDHDVYEELVQKVNAALEQRQRDMRNLERLERVNWQG